MKYFSVMFCLHDPREKYRFCLFSLNVFEIQIIFKMRSIWTRVGGNCNVTMATDNRKQSKINK